MNTICIILFANLTEKKEIITRIVQKYFSTLSSVLTIKKIPFQLSARIIIDFFDLKDLSDFRSNHEIIQYYKSKHQTNSLLLGIFNNLLNTQTSLQTIKPFISEDSYVFGNYDPESTLLANDEVIPFVILNEFVNWMFSLIEKSLELHDGECIRHIQQPTNLFQPLSSANYTIKEKIRYCAICSDKIVKGWNKIQTNKSLELKIQEETTYINNTIDVISAASASEQQNPILRATPPPRKSEAIDPNQELSFGQRKQMNEILKHLNLHKEPTEDPEYTETRKRFFEGKISEQVFLQILRRKSK